jgi:hypothetical protein
MPRKKKHPIEWTTEEAMRKLFHPKIRKKVREELDAIENPKKSTKPNDK